MRDVTGDETTAITMTLVAAEPTAAVIGAIVKMAAVVLVEIAIMTVAGGATTSGTEITETIRVQLIRANRDHGAWAAAPQTTVPHRRPLIVVVAIVATVPSSTIVVAVIVEIATDLAAEDAENTNLEEVVAVAEVVRLHCLAMNCPLKDHVSSCNRALCPCPS